jgi:hypothetical protein
MVFKVSQKLFSTGVKPVFFDVFNVYSLLKRKDDQLGRELPLFTGQSYPCYSTEKLLPNKVLI